MTDGWAKQPFPGWNTTLIRAQVDPNALQYPFLDETGYISNERLFTFFKNMLAPDNPEWFNKTLVCIEILAGVLTGLVAMALIYTLFKTPFWLFKTIKTPRGKLWVPNALISPALFSTVFLIMWLFGSTEVRKQGIRTCFWIYFPWDVVFLGSYWSAWGVFIANIASDQSHERVSTTGRFFSHPYFLNFCMVFFPLLKHVFIESAQYYALVKSIRYTHSTIEPFMAELGQVALSEPLGTASDDFQWRGRLIWATMAELQFIMTLVGASNLPIMLAYEVFIAFLAVRVVKSLFVHQYSIHPMRPHAFKGATASVNETFRSKLLFMCRNRVSNCQGGDTEKAKIYIKMVRATSFITAQFGTGLLVVAAIAGIQAWSCISTLPYFLVYGDGRKVFYTCFICSSVVVPALALFTLTLKFYSYKNLFKKPSKESSSSRSRSGSRTAEQPGSCLRLKRCASSTPNTPTELYPGPKKDAGDLSSDGSPRGVMIHTSYIEVKSVPREKVSGHARGDSIEVDSVAPNLKRENSTSQFDPFRDRWWSDSRDMPFQ